MMVEGPADAPEEKCSEVFASKISERYECGTHSRIKDASQPTAYATVSRAFQEGTVSLLCRRIFMVVAASLMAMTALAADNPRAGNHPAQSWRALLNDELPLLGHRNWIAIVDSAYPLQTSAGVETVETDADQLEVVKAVLNQLAHAKHVRPDVFTDTELMLVPESDAKGVTAYREALANLLSTTAAQSLPHEEIITKLDEAGKTFHVLVLKTRMTIPYTSVFIRLECAYWSDDAEKRLRDAMAAH
jgi:hypothetical protein